METNSRHSVVQYEKERFENNKHIEQEQFNHGESPWPVYYKPSFFAGEYNSYESDFGILIPRPCNNFKELVNRIRNNGNIVSTLDLMGPGYAAINSNKKLGVTIMKPPSDFLGFDIPGSQIFEQNIFEESTWVNIKKYSKKETQGGFDLMLFRPGGGIDKYKTEQISNIYMKIYIIMLRRAWKMLKENGMMFIEIPRNIKYCPDNGELENLGKMLCKDTDSIEINFLHRPHLKGMFEGLMSIKKINKEESSQFMSSSILDPIANRYHQY